MADVVTVFDRRGRPLCELNVSVTRHQKLDHTVDIDRGMFKIPVSDPKATDVILKRNNFVLVTSNQRGIKAFCALMYFDENVGLKINSNAEYEVQLRGVETLLMQRITAPIEKIDIPLTPGQTFIRILDIAQKSGAFLPLSQNRDGINGVGVPVQHEWNLTECYGIVTALATDNDMYWGFNASRDYNANTGAGTGNLVLTPYFKPKIGATYTQNIVARTSGGSSTSADSANLVGGQISEKSINAYANRIVGYGKMDDWKQNIVYTADNDEDQGSFGVIERAISVTTATNIESLKPKVEKELKLSRNRLYVDGTLINVNAFPQVGDVALVQPDYMGSTMLARRYGNTLRMRVKETNYDPQNNTMAVTLEGLFKDE